MFGKKKEVKKERPARPAGSLAQYGIFEIPENLGDLGGPMDLDDDDDLEAELAALTTSDQPKRPVRRKAPPKPAVDLDKMINESIKDINSDEELSGDDDDPDLLNELKAITGESEDEPMDKPEHTNNDMNEIVKQLEERLSMYIIAEKKAKSENESTKARRYNRGIKTLEHLLSSSRSGNQIDPSEIPPVLPPSAYKESEKPATEPKMPAATEPAEVSPEVTTTPENHSPTAEPEPKLASEEPSTGKVDEETFKILKCRQEEYKNAALAWKKSGNREEALELMKVVKQFDTVIAAISQGDAMDLSDMPPPPTLPICTVASENTSEQDKEENSNQKASVNQPSVPASSSQASTPISLETALKERLEIYHRSKTVAETEGNASKARRYGRICKQFEDALKLHSRGRPISIDELPTPPGFPPLSELIGAKPPLPKPLPDAEEVVQSLKRSKPSEPEEPSQPAEPSASRPEKQTAPVAPPRTNSDKSKKLTTRVDKQIEALKNRQKELRNAAKIALTAGDKDLAKDYLRQAKGIDPLLNASLSGLPVDMNSIPLSPDAKLDLQDQETESAKVNDDGFTVITSMDCSEEATGTDQQIYDNLEAQLKKQIKWCLATRDHCKATGDVSSYNKWERLALNYTKYLDMLRVRKRDNLPPPQHHYEMKTHSIVQSCTDMADADIEISIIRGINYPKELDTYVMFELPLPSDSSTSDKTSTIRDSNNPEYDATFPLNGIIDRKSRQCLRVFKRHALKCQVWSKGGFFRADSLVGTVTVKLQPLETKCILHDSFPLMEGRKAVGGNLEVKIRLRNPIQTKQIEQNTDKWLAIDY